MCSQDKDLMDHTSQEWQNGVHKYRKFMELNEPKNEDVVKLFAISSHYMAITPLGKTPKKDKDLK